MEIIENVMDQVCLWKFYLDRDGSKSIAVVLHDLVRSYQKEDT